MVHSQPFHLGPGSHFSCLLVGEAQISSTSCLHLLNLWQMQWHPTPVLLPGKSHGWRSLVGCSLWGPSELDMSEPLHFHFSLSCIGGHENPLQCSCLRNLRDGGAWWAAVYGPHRVRHNCSDLATVALHLYKLKAGIYPAVQWLKTSYCQCRGLDSIPGYGTKIPHAKEETKSSKRDKPKTPPKASV